MRAQQVVTVLLLLAGVALQAAAPGVEGQPFLQKNCVECHDSDTKKGGLDLTALQRDFADSTNFTQWVLVHDRVTNGEMPPRKKARPDAAELAAFT